MKQFIYLDTDIVTSIIAQAEKGYITQQTNESESGTEKSNSKTGTAGIEASGGGSFWKFLQAEGKVSAAGELSVSNTSQSSTRAVVEKILHDAAFDIAYGYIKPSATALGNQDNDEEGNYLEVKRIFDFVDFDYMERLFEKGGIVDLMKKISADQIEGNAGKLTSDYNREQSRKASSQIKSELKKAIDINNKQFDDVAAIIKAFRCIIPYNRMLLSRDGYLIPLDDKYFRIDPSNLGFKYGGEMTCVGMVTNIIGESTDPADPHNVFATIQYRANETLRKLLPTIEHDLCVIHPIAVYYGQ